jgi:hypothetical protein
MLDRALNLNDRFPGTVSVFGNPLFDLRPIYGADDTAFHQFREASRSPKRTEVGVLVLHQAERPQASGVGTAIDRPTTHDSTQSPYDWPTTETGIDRLIDCKARKRIHAASRFSEYTSATCPR